MTIKTNSDKKIVGKIRRQFKENGNICPRYKAQDSQNTCFCTEFIKQMLDNKLGECPCGLYIITEVD